jgi:hypothetical protein
MSASTIQKLKEKVDSADREIRDAAAQGADELKAMVDEARQKADVRAAALKAKSEEAADDAKHQWNEMQSDWDKHVKRIRERIDANKAAHDADCRGDDRPKATR